MSDKAKQWLESLDKLPFERSQLRKYAELLDSYHNSMSDVSDGEIVLKIMDIITDEFGEMITSENAGYYGRVVDCLKKLSDWFCSRLPNKVDVKKLRNKFFDWMYKENRLNITSDEIVDFFITELNIKQ